MKYLTAISILKGRGTGYNFDAIESFFWACFFSHASNTRRDSAERSIKESYKDLYSGLSSVKLTFRFCL